MKDPDPARVVYLNRPDLNIGFVDNGVSSAKYTLQPLSLHFFVWKILAEQFHRVANIYFLIIACLQLIPGLSPTGRFSTALTLLFVVSISACKAAYDDWQRHKSDYMTNSRPVKVLRGTTWEEIPSKRIQVGDVIKVSEHEEVAADLVLLASSDHDGGAYVETSKLDGEANLKPRHAVLQEMGVVNVGMKVGIRCDLPSKEVHSFGGTIQVADRILSLAPKHLVLRGSVLRRVDYVYGVAVYTGPDTKMMMNANQPPYKVSSMEQLVNKFLFFVLIIQFIMCGGCTLGARYFGDKREALWYLRLEPTSESYILGFITFLILLNNFIPISLYVSMEVAKTIQGLFISADIKLYNSMHDASAVVHSTALNDELGRVNHMFVDKTGTITCNKMRLFRFTVCGQSFGEGITAVERASNPLVAHPASPTTLSTHATFAGIMAEGGADVKLRFTDERIDNGIWYHGEGMDERVRDGIIELFTLITVCNTVMVVDHGERDDGPIYEANSTDEMALMEGARTIGFKLISRSAGHITISVYGTKSKYRILHVLEFTSERRRMSVIVRSLETDEIVIYTKGADSVIVTRLATNLDSRELRTQRSCVGHLDNYAAEGLRTLMMAKRTITDDFYNEWNDLWEDASSLTAEERATAQSRLAEEIERDLVPIGATAIEDELSPRVLEVIRNFRIAGIRVWMLTGDKRETAINIANACGLITMGMPLIVFTEMDEEELKNEVNELGEANFCLVLDGEAIPHILNSPSLRETLFHVAHKCSTVVSYRMSPLGKAEIVQFVREHKSLCTLAIGDGANDVSMIQAAHIGIGIDAMEGRQAANSADYSIARFDHLERLLFVHGRLNHERMASLVLYSFYKNAVIFLTQLWYCGYNGFSGASLYDNTTLSMWNVVWTSLPILAVAILEIDLPPDLSACYPLLYTQRRALTAEEILKGILLAAFQSMVIFIIVLHTADVAPNGRQYGLYTEGCMLFTCALFVANLKLALHIRSWTWIHHVSIWGTLMTWVAYLAVYQYIPQLSSEYYQVFNILIQSVRFYGVVALSVVTALIPDYLHVYGMFNVAPLSSIAVMLRELKTISNSSQPKQEVRHLKKRLIQTSHRREEAKKMLVSSEATPEDTMRTVYKQHPCLLTFHDPEIERGFRLAHMGCLKRYLVATSMAAAFSIFIFLHSIWFHPENSLAITMWGLFFGTMLITSIITHVMKATLAPHMPVLFFFVVAYSMTLVAVYHFSVGPLESNPVSLTLVMWGVINVARPPFLHAVVYAVSAMFMITYAYIASRGGQWETLDATVRLFEVAVVATLGLVSLWDSERFFRNVHMSSKILRHSRDTLEKEQRRQVNLLCNVLPRPIATMVLRGVAHSAFSMTFPEASVLQFDMVRFTQMSSTHDAAVIVKILNELFTNCDELCEDLRVEKIKCVGDAYICAAGVPVPDPQHAEKIAYLGLAILDTLDSINCRNEEDLQIRIGIASGLVTTAIVGTMKMSFELFGPTMDAVQVMEQTGEPDRVHCTDSMVGVLIDKFNIQTDALDRKFVVSALNCVPAYPALNAENMPISDQESEHTFPADMDGDAHLRVDVGADDKDDTALTTNDTFPRNFVTLRFRSSDVEELFVSCVCRLWPYQILIQFTVALLIFSVMSPWTNHIFNRQKLDGQSTLDLTPLTIIIYASLGYHIIVIAILLAVPTTRKAVLQKVVTEDSSSFAFNFIKLVSTISVVFCVATTITTLILAKNTPRVGPVGTIMMALLLMYMSRYHHFLYWVKLIFLLIFLVAHIFVLIYNNGNSSTLPADVFGFIVASFLVAIIARDMEGSIRSNFVTVQRCHQQQLHLLDAMGTNETILLHTLPETILQRMKNQKTIEIIDTVDDASVMFILFDVPQGGSDKSVIKYINDLNQVLDEVVANVPDVEKVKSMPYMVMAGCPVARENHALILCRLACQIMQIVRRMDNIGDKFNSTKPRMKIGIHAGPLCAAVLGLTKFNYDIFGDTVNQASRYATSCEWNQIMISEDVMDVAKRSLDVVYRGIVDLKHKGPTPCWYLDYQAVGLHGFHETVRIHGLTNSDPVSGNGGRARGIPVRQGSPQSNELTVSRKPSGHSWENPLPRSPPYITSNPASSFADLLQDVTQIRHNRMALRRNSSIRTGPLEFETTPMSISELERRGSQHSGGLSPVAGERRGSILPYPGGRRASALPGRIGSPVHRKQSAQLGRRPQSAVSNQVNNPLQASRMMQKRRRTSGGDGSSIQSLENAKGPESVAQSHRGTSAVATSHVMGSSHPNHPHSNPHPTTPQGE